MESTVRVALVGPGAIGERHLASLRAAGATVTTVAGATLAEAEEFSEKNGIGHASADIHEAVRGDVDAVVIASPTPLHAEQMRVALEAGLPVLCEIPCAVNAADARQLAQLAGNIPAMVCHTFRFAEPYRRLRELIVSGEFSPRHIVGTQLSLRQENIGWTGRRRDWTDDILWHHGGHLFDIALWFLNDDVDRVSGTVGPAWPGSGSYMDTAAVVTTAGGAIASLSMSYHSRVPVNTLTVIGEDDTYQLAGGTLHRNGEIALDMGSWDDMMFDAQTRQDREFIDSIRQWRQPECSIHDILPAMEVMQRVADHTAGRR